MLRFDIDEADDWFIGEDKQIIGTIYQADKRTKQAITGWSLSWMLKTALTSTTAILTKTTGSGITITAPTIGGITIAIADTDTDSLEPGRYVHELKRTDASRETVLWQGTCVLRRGVHRS